MDPAQATFFATGLCFSIVGTAMWAWNDFGLWIATELADSGRAIGLEFRRALIRLHIVKLEPVAETGTSVGNLTGFATGYTTLGEGASLEDRVEFLMRAHGEHETQLQLLRRELKEQIERLRAETHQEIAIQIQRATDDNIRVRRVGVAFVIVGIVLLAVTSFV